MAEAPKPFILLFDSAFLNNLRKKYRIGFLGGFPKVFLESARRQNIKIGQISKEELKEWKNNVERLGRDEHQLAKNVARSALLGVAAAGLNMPFQVTGGLKFEDPESILLMFSFPVGSVLKTLIFGVIVFPSTIHVKETVLQYFKTLASEASTYPISEKLWLNSEKTRQRMASRASDTEGLDKNLWKSII